MKYICTNDFANPPGNPISIGNITDEGGKVREQKPVAGGTITKGNKVIQAHIHKGVVFEIGSATEFKDLSPAEKTLVSQLILARKIAEATPNTIAKVDAEVTLDAKRQAADEALAKSSKVVSVSEVLSAIPKLVADAAAAAVVAALATKAPAAPAK